jgi:hypothetical protein
MDHQPEMLDVMQRNSKFGSNIGIWLKQGRLIPMQKHVQSYLFLVAALMIATAAPWAGAVPTVGTNFVGLEDDNSNTIIPPDTMGAVGPSHVTTILNTQVTIQDKTGRQRLRRRIGLAE